MHFKSVYTILFLIFNFLWRRICVVSSILFKGSTAGHDDSCLLARKLKEFEAAGFVVKDGQKSIHEENTVAFVS